MFLVFFKLFLHRQGMLKKSQFIFVFLFLLFSSCSFHFSNNNDLSIAVGNIVGNGISKTQKRVFQDFNALVVDGSIATIVTFDDRQRLSVSADENLVDHIKTEFKDGTLRIYADTSYTSSLPLFVSLYAKELRQISVSGSATSSVAGIKNDSLNIRIAGSGLVSLTGQTNHLDVEISGSGRLLANELLVQNAKVVVAGSATASVNPVIQLDAEVKGSGVILYVNTPAQLNQRVAGSGKILRAN